MTPQEYEVMYRVEDRHWWYAGLRAMLRRHMDADVQGAAARVLDIGCGCGANLQLLNERGATAFGMDVATDALRFCRERGQARLARGSADRLPFADASFDAAVSMDVLCHRSIPDHRGALTEIRRVLRPGGALLLNLPAYPWLHSTHDDAVETSWRTNRDELRGLLLDSGFAPVRLTHWNALLFPVVVAVRLWKRRHPPARLVSDLHGAPPAWLNAVLRGIVQIDALIASVVGLPFGSSVFAVARAV